MSRFSPTVKPTTAPSGIGALAAALQEGIAGFQGQRDRQEAKRSRAFNQDLQRGQALRQGISVDTPPEPEGFGAAFTRALAGAPEPQRQAVVPRAFVVERGDFEDVDPRTGQPKSQPTLQPRLPTMRAGNATYDPNVELDREMAEATAKGELGLTMGARGRQQRRGELESALTSVDGAPLGAAASESAAADWLSRPPRVQEPLVVVETPDGPRYIPRSQAAGSTPGRAPTASSGRVAVKVQQDLKDITYGLDGIERAIGLVNDNPKAFGLKNILGPTIVDRLDPEGIQARTAVENIVSAIRHSLYGAALTRPEIQRALTNLPDVKNDPEGAIVRLRELAVKLQQERSAIEKSLGETNTMSAGGGADDDPPPAGGVNIQQFGPRRTP